MDTSHKGDEHGEQHHDAESPPPYTRREGAGYTGNDNSDTVDNAATGSAEATVVQLDRTQADKKGKDTEGGRGLIGKLKKLEDKLIGTEEERAQERAERERKTEEENERQRAAYQKQLKRQQEFYAERDARQQQSGRVAADAGHEFRGFGDWYE